MYCIFTYIWLKFMYTYTSPIYPIIYRVLAPSQVVQDFFHQPLYTQKKLFSLPENHIYGTPENWCKGLPSFSSIDFGPCFVGGLGHVPSKTYLLGHVGQDWDGHHLHAQENSRLVRSRNVELIKELFGVPSIWVVVSIQIVVINTITGDIVEIKRVCKISSSSIPPSRKWNYRVQHPAVLACPIYGFLGKKNSHTHNSKGLCIEIFQQNRMQLPPQTYTFAPSTAQILSNIFHLRGGRWNSWMPTEGSVDNSCYAIDLVGRHCRSTQAHDRLRREA